MRRKNLKYWYEEKHDLLFSEEGTLAEVGGAGS